VQPELQAKVIIAISISLERVMLDVEVQVAEVERNLFPMSLIGATMQDGG